MAFDEGLAERIRDALTANGRTFREKKMFGGIAWLFDGAMGVGIAKNKLMVRVGPDAYEAALAEPHVEPMDFTGKPLRGYVYVADAGVATDAALARWTLRGADFARTVAAEALAPSKAPRARRSDPLAEKRRK
jgi:TfoX/Sxy family transcriptional regulator of competence genes